jgi:hypothetical protein
MATRARQAPSAPRLDHECPGADGAAAKLAHPRPLSVGRSVSRSSAMADPKEKAPRERGRYSVECVAGPRAAAGGGISARARRAHPSTEPPSSACSFRNNKPPAPIPAPGFVHTSLAKVTSRVKFFPQSQPRKASSGHVSGTMRSFPLQLQHVGASRHAARRSARSRLPAANQVGPAALRSPNRRSNRAPSRTGGCNGPTPGATAPEPAPDGIGGGRPTGPAIPPFRPRIRAAGGPRPFGGSPGVPGHHPAPGWPPGLGKRRPRRGSIVSAPARTVRTVAAAYLPLKKKKPNPSYSELPLYISSVLISSLSSRAHA